MGVFSLCTKNNLKILILGFFSYAAICQAMPIIEFDCLIKPYKVINLNSPIDGIIDEIYVERSQKVTEDQTIAWLEASVERARIKLAQLKVDKAHEILSTKHHLDYLIKSSSRHYDLYKNHNGPLEKAEKISTELELARSQYINTVKSQKIAKLELKILTAELELKHIKSPVTGIIIDQNVLKGETVEDKTIVTIAVLNPLRVDVIVPASYFGKFKVGMKAIVMPELYNDNKYQATISLVDKVIHPASGTFDIRLKLENPKNKLPSGLKCKVIFK